MFTHSCRWSNINFFSGINFINSKTLSQFYVHHRLNIECLLNYSPLAWGIISGSFSKLSMLSELRGRVDDLSRGEELPVPDAARFAMPPSSWESLSSWDLARSRNFTARVITKPTSRTPAVDPTTMPNSGPDSDSIFGVRAENHVKYHEYFPLFPFLLRTVREAIGFLFGIILIRIIIRNDLSWLQSLKRKLKRFSSWIRFLDFQDFYKSSYKIIGKALIGQVK